MWKWLGLSRIPSQFSFTWSSSSTIAQTHKLLPVLCLPLFSMTSPKAHLYNSVNFLGHKLSQPIVPPLPTASLFKSWTLSHNKTFHSLLSLVQTWSHCKIWTSLISECTASLSQDKLAVYKQYSIFKWLSVIVKMSEWSNKASFIALGISHKCIQWINGRNKRWMWYVDGTLLSD